MSHKELINESISDEIVEHLTKIEQEYDVIVLQAIESGSRAWGFPSPDSDYDVRFIYAHPKDWYLQLSEERDVIELPINDELDIAGWDLRKALNLANKGNAVVQEWMISPIVYQQSASYASLSALIGSAFNPIATYHHYRSMAKKAYADIEQSEQKKLKLFFYFARATLSAKWIVEKQTMPSILFDDLVQELVSDQALIKSIDLLVKQKAKEPERSNLEVPMELVEFVVSMYQSFDEQVAFKKETGLVSNDDFRNFLRTER